jgi:hypothetical protein
MKISAKFTILSYIGTYYAIAASLPLCVMNYFLTGWFADNLDHAYMPSWNMLCGTLFIFLAVSPLAFALYRHRLGNKNFFWAVLEAFTWMPFFSMRCFLFLTLLSPYIIRLYQISSFYPLTNYLAVVFFGGLSWHISYALLAHMFCLPIEWSSTAKELEGGGIFVGIDKVWKAFRFAIGFMVLLTGVIIYLGLFAPHGWEIISWTSIFPVANQVFGHVLLPVLTILL